MTDCDKKNHANAVNPFARRHCLPPRVQLRVGRSPLGRERCVSVRRPCVLFRAKSHWVFWIETNSARKRRFGRAASWLLTESCWRAGRCHTQIIISLAAGKRPDLSRQAHRNYWHKYPQRAAVSWLATFSPALSRLLLPLYLILLFFSTPQNLNEGADGPRRRDFFPPFVTHFFLCVCQGDCSVSLRCGLRWQL